MRFTGSRGPRVPVPGILARRHSLNEGAARGALLDPEVTERTTSRTALATANAQS
jgi:hypothetical protein